MTRFQYTNTFNNKFMRIYREINIIKGKINRKSGFLFFQKHVYTKDDLLKEISFGRIYSISEKIHDDINNWIEHKNLSWSAQKWYNKDCHKLYEDLDSLAKEVENRKSTWLENFIEFLNSLSAFVKLIKIILPIIALSLPALFHGTILSYFPFLKKRVQLPVGSSDPDEDSMDQDDSEEV